ncbi:MAG: NTP transferase domain-containing protein [Candidatus Bathyarchaeota archaeon]|nr:MAG: NTP transferase domain-containing protein [Candidatus Bathyarchaeota archaeon]
MKVPALIMAGGKGKRMGLAIEKPLLPFLGKPLIDRVVEAVESSKKISEFYIVTSESTPQTEEKCLKESLKIIRTAGKGYHEDLKQAILKAQLDCPVLIIPADLPAITGKFLDKVVKAYEVCGKDALAVFVPIRTREELELSISSTDFHEGLLYAVSGVNIINGAKIDEAKIPTRAIITEDIEVLLNVNTLKDLDVAEKIMRKSKN